MDKLKVWIKDKKNIAMIIVMLIVVTIVGVSITNAGKDGDPKDTPIVDNTEEVARDS